MDDRCYEFNSPTVAHQIIDGEAVLVHFGSGCYYSTDSLGAEILDQLDGDSSVSALIEHVSRRYGADETTAREAVSPFLDELLEEDLVAPVSATPTGNGPDRPGTERLAAPNGASSPIERPLLHKYTDLQDLLLLDPIHEVDETGWPAAAADQPV
jgi:hypothetical protein